MLSVLAPYVGTSFDVAEDMLGIAEVSCRDVVFDLGCGEGNIIIVAAEKFKAFSVGVEIRPELCVKAWNRIKDRHLQHLAQIVCGDLRFFPLSKATVITLYLTTKANEVLKDKIMSECRSGTRIVANMFPIPGLWEGEIVNRYDPEKPYTIYLYKIKRREKRRGLEEESLELDLTPPIISYFEDNPIIIPLNIILN